MRQLILAGLVVGLFSTSAAFAQNNGSYVDDVYYNGSQAQKDAKADAKRQKKEQQQAPDNAEQYNSSTGTNDGYNTDGYAYNDSYSNGDDTYIDYDDDSYTSRIRRFQYPMSNVGYWGSVYSPYFYDPFYSNPFYSWGGWYTPGFSMGFGFGGGPYWNNCWGMNTWFGYGMFNNWYYPYGGFGGWGGYGGGYWNGYYAGLYDGGLYNGNRYGNGRGAVNYGPRGSRNGATSLGSYGRSTGMRSTGNSMVEPMNGRGGRRDLSTNQNGAAVNGNGRTMQANGNGRAMQVDGVRPGRTINGNDAVRLDNNGRSAMEFNQNNANGGTQQAAPARRGFFNRGGNNASEMNAQPSRNYNNVERSAPSAQPSRNYSPSPAPSRSFSPSAAPSRSFGGGSGGGGGRVGGARR